MRCPECGNELTFWEDVTARREIVKTNWLSVVVDTWSEVQWADTHNERLLCVECGWHCDLAPEQVLVAGVS